MIASNYNYQTKKYINQNDYYIDNNDGVDFLWINVPPYTTNSWDRLWNMATFFHKVRFIPKKLNLPDPDIIIGSSPQPFAALGAEHLALYYKVPFVMEVRDLWPQSLIDLGKTSKYHPFILLLSWLEKYLYRKSVKIVTVLPGMVNYISKLGFSREKVEWVPNGIDISLIPEFKKTTKQTNLFTVMYTGAHGVANSLDTILYAAEVLKKQGYEDKILFRFIGDGIEKRNLINLTNQLNLKNVIFEDPVPKKVIFKKMYEADALIAVMKKTDLYKWGISFNKLYDYLAVSKPIIFSVDSYNDPVKEANAGISVPPEDPIALANAIINLYNMTDEDREQMGKRGKAYVEKNYDFAELSAKLEKVLFESINSNSKKDSSLGEYHEN